MADKKGITTGHAIIKSEEIETVLIANNTSKAKWIPQQTVVGAAIEIDTFEQETTEQKIEASRNVIANIPPKEETRSEMKFDEQIASSIDPEEREKLKDLLAEFKTLFATSNAELGIGNVSEHSHPQFVESSRDYSETSKRNGGNRHH